MSNENFLISFILKLQDDLTSPLAKVGGAFQDMHNSVTSATSKIKAALTTGAFTAWAVKSAETADEVKIAFREMGHSLEKLSPEGLDDVKNSIVELNKVVPFSKAELAGFAKAAGKMGELSNVKGFMDFMTQFTTANEDMRGEGGTGAWLDMVKAVGATQAEYANLGDGITAVTQRFNTSARAIVEGTTDLAGFKIMAGATKQEVMALSAWGDTFGTTGGMAMKRFTSVMADAASGANALGPVIGKIMGTDHAGFQKIFKESPVQAMSELLKGFAKMGKTGDTFALIKGLETLGLDGGRIRGFMLKGAEGAARLEEILKLLNNTTEINGVMAKDAKARWGDLGNQMTITKHAFDAFNEQFGNDFSPILEGINKGLASMLHDFSQLPKGVRTLIELGAAFGTLKGILTLLGPVLERFGIQLTMAMGPIGIALSAMLLIMSYQKEIRDWFDESVKSGVLNSLGEGINGANDWIKSMQIKAGFSPELVYGGAAGALNSGKTGVDIRVYADKGVRVGEVNADRNADVRRHDNDAYAGPPQANGRF